MNFTTKVFLMMLFTMILKCMVAGFTCAEVSEEEIVAMWLFDEGSGDVARDSSPNGNDAVFNGGAKWDNGKFGKGISLDGTDDYLSAQDSDSLDISGEAMTIVAWANSDAWTASWNHIIRKAPENPRIYILGVHNTGLAFTFLKTDAMQVSDIQGATALPTGEWIHLAMTYDGQEVVIYVNGEVDATAPASGVIEASEDELRIGRGAPAGYFTGTLDEIAIFSVALDQDEIKDIMNEGFSGFLAVKPQNKLAETWGSVKTGG
jgi:hypothetical protein